MRIVGAVIVGIICMIVGYVAAAVLSYVVMGALGVSDFEGKRAMLSALTWGPLGGLLCLGCGIWFVLRITRRPN
jgi:hypothetical protein